MANIERLRELRRVVEAAPAERFDMAHVTWGLGCGTTHCAYGWARVDPWFRENTEIEDVMYVSAPGIFDLSRGDVDNLFDPPEFDTARPSMKAEVLANIARVIAGQPALPYEPYASDPGDDPDYD